MIPTFLKGGIGQILCDFTPSDDCPSIWRDSCQENIFLLNTKYTYVNLKNKQIPFLILLKLYRRIHIFGTYNVDLLHRNCSNKASMLFDVLFHVMWLYLCP